MKKYTYITITQTMEDRYLVNAGEGFDLEKIEALRNYSENREVIIFDTTFENTSDKNCQLFTQLHWFAGMDSFPITMNQKTLSNFLFPTREGGQEIKTLEQIKHTINVRDTIYPKDVYFFTYSLTIEEFIEKAGDINFNYYISKLDTIKKDNCVFVTFGFTNELDHLKNHECYSKMHVLNSFSPFETFLKATGILPFHFGPIPLIKYNILVSDILLFKGFFEAA